MSRKKPGTLRFMERSLLAWLAIALIGVAAPVPAQNQATNAKKSESKAPAASTEEPKNGPVSPLLVNASPKSVQDLKEMEKAVQNNLPKMLGATVGVQVGTSAGSGIIIDAEGHVLTAAHVVGAPNRRVQFILPNGKRVYGKTLGANLDIDAGLMKINDKVSFPHVEMADYSKVRAGVWCICIGHPGGFQTGRDPVVRFGRIIYRDSKLIQSDCTITPGDSGGPLFDLQGRVIGIHSRIGDDLSANVHVPIAAYKDDWNAMLAGEIWGKDVKPYFGILADVEVKNQAKIAQVHDGSPAHKAELKEGDIILKYNNVVIDSFESLSQQVRKTHANQLVKVEVKRGEETVNKTVKILQAPSVR